MSRSVENLFAPLDCVDAPDLWSDIVARASATSSNSRSVESSRDLESALDDVELGDSTKRGDMNRSRWIVVVGVAAAAVAMIVVLSVVGDSGETTIDQTPATDPQVSTETLPAPFGTDDALRVAGAYFDASNSGDVEALLALFTPDATFNLGVGPETRIEFEQIVAWNAAQRTVLTPPDCDTQVVTSEEVDARCRFDSLDALVQAVDGPPVSIFMTLTVTPDGISDLVQTFGSPDFNTVGIPFASWMLENNPDDADRVQFGNWSSVEEAEQDGQLTVRYAAEWAAYLEVNDCVDRTRSGQFTFVVTC